MSTLTYISANALPCLYWLDARSNITLTAVDFTWQSVIGTVSFYTSNFANLPTIVNNTVSVPALAFIESVAPFNINTHTFTVCCLSKTPDNKVFDAPDLSLTPTNIDFSRVGYKGNNTLSTAATGINAYTFNLRNRSVLKTTLVEDIIYSNLFLLPEQAEVSLSGKHKIEGSQSSISHLLFFTAALTGAHIENILRSLLAETPSLQNEVYWDTLLWEDITTEIWDKIK